MLAVVGNVKCQNVCGVLRFPIGWFAMTQHPGSAPFRSLTGRQRTPGPCCADVNWNSGSVVTAKATHNKCRIPTSSGVESPNAWLARREHMGGIDSLGFERADRPAANILYRQNPETLGFHGKTQNTHRCARIARRVQKSSEPAERSEI